MKSTQYLYGIDAVELENKFYKEALQYKLDAGRRLFRELYHKQDKTKDEQDREFYVCKALEHTEKLIAEMEGADVF